MSDNVMAFNTLADKSLSFEGTQREGPARAGRTYLSIFGTRHPQQKPIRITRSGAQTFHFNLFGQMELSRYYTCILIRLNRVKLAQFIKNFGPVTCFSALLKAALSVGNGTFCKHNHQLYFLMRVDAHFQIELSPKLNKHPITKSGLKYPDKSLLNSNRRTYTRAYTGCLSKTLG